MKRPKFSLLTTFIFKVLLLLPVCLAAWYWLITPLNTPLAWLSDFILTTLWGQIIETVELIKHQFEIVTLLAPPGQAHNSQASMVFEINPLLYSYSLPFAAALILATPATWAKKLTALLITYCLLLLVQSWGVCFHVVKTLVYHAGPEINARLNMHPLSQALIGLGYQFGYLILPSLSPLVIWIALFRNFVLSIAPQLTVWEQQTKQQKW
jgi:hypothetical protein